MYDRGTYFLSDVIEDHGYTLPDIQLVDENSLLTLYCRDFVEDIEFEFIEEPVTSWALNQTVGTGHDAVMDGIDSQMENVREAEMHKISQV